MILPIIALLLLGTPTTAQNTVAGSGIAVLVPQKEKTIQLDINNDKGLKAKFPDAVKFYALQVEVIVGDGSRALTSEKQGSYEVKDIALNCRDHNELESYAVKNISLSNFSELSFNNVVIEVIQLVYVNKEGKIITPISSHFYTTRVKV
jgi:hypothetical protein